MEHTPPLANTLGSAYSTGAVTGESLVSGISWAAVIGGAFVAAALSLILLSLGTGLGLSSVSPWSNTGISAATLGMAAIIWLIVTQILASAFGGYLAGRLRTKWTNVHTDEVYFRDTAHGLLVWAVGMVITAGFLVSAATSMIGGATQAGTQAVASSAMPTGDGSNAYFVDGLFRSNQISAEPTNGSLRGEATRILTNALRDGSMTPPDKTYLAQLVAARTGLTQAEAEQRVSQIFTAAQQAIDTARKSAAHLSLWIFVALLAGAFFASYAATIGGRQRDHLTAI